MLTSSPSALGGSTSHSPTANRVSLRSCSHRTRCFISARNSRRISSALYRIGPLSLATDGGEGRPPLRSAADVGGGETALVEGRLFPGKVLDSTAVLSPSRPSKAPSPPL